MWQPFDFESVGVSCLTFLLSWNKFPWIKIVKAVIIFYSFVFTYYTHLTVIKELPLRLKCTYVACQYLLKLVEIHLIWANSEESHSKLNTSKMNASANNTSGLKNKKYHKTVTTKVLQLHRLICQLQPIISWIIMYQQCAVIKSRSKVFMNF